MKSTTHQPNRQDSLGIPLCEFKMLPKYRHSYVYLIEDRATNQFKIGHAVNPRTRFLQMLRQWPNRDLHLIVAGRAEITGDGRQLAARIESEMHRMFYKDRYGGTGDWFSMKVLSEAIDFLGGHALLVEPRDLLSMELSR